MFTIDSGRYVGSDRVALYHETDGNFAVDVVGNKLRSLVVSYDSAFKVLNLKM